jgi:hypothetical protein
MPAISPWEHRQGLVTMSDAYFEERARRRTRVLWIIGGTVVVLACAIAGAGSLFYDACTKSFDRLPHAVVSAYVEAVSHGNAPVAQECWEHNAYYSLDAGCSEICLSKALGSGFQVLDVALGSPSVTAAGRENLTATVSIACGSNGPQYTGEITLDSVGSHLPWRHWAIVRSTLGGTVAEPWCK